MGPIPAAMPVPAVLAAFSATDAVGVAVLAGLAALLVAAFVRIARARGGAPGAPARPAPPPAPPPRDPAPRAAEPARAPRPPPPPPAAAAPPETPEAAEAAEARKRAEYHAKKETERLEKERRRQEREEEEARARAEAERAAAAAAEARRRAEEEERRRIAAEAGKTLAAGLEKTRGGFVARLSALLGAGKEVDESVLAELEEVLFTADIGVKTASRLLEAVRERVRSRELSDAGKVRGALKAEIRRILSLDGRLSGEQPLAVGPERPWVVLVVGVNGSGKTTTIGKLAAKLKGAGHSVLLGAGDTFRAAAGEQLEIWAERVGAPIVRGKEGGDPASVCFEAVQRGATERVDVVLCDTAGRLHTKAPLMEELKKVKRVVAKAAPGAPAEVLLVLDSTTGQNGIAQARQFHEALGVTGLVLTKLDGTAKGGVVIGISDELKLPVRYVGVGEAVGDLKPFDPDAFVEALFS
jgi:fused signal recognition particle receptor